MSSKIKNGKHRNAPTIELVDVLTLSELRSVNNTLPPFLF
jgi:hypothetical protein